MRVPVVLPHFFDFHGSAPVGRSIMSAGAWDALRLSDSAFGLPANREALDALADAHGALSHRARALSGLIQDVGAEAVASYGVGIATLELTLLRIDPQLRVAVGEFAPATVERLRTVAPELTPRVHDLLRDEPFEADVHLLYRVDTEFGPRQWRQVLARFAGRRVIVVGSDVMSLREMSHGVIVAARAWRSTSHAGWMRNRAAFERGWRDTHVGERVAVADMEGWVLSPR
jgi:hypothetical protein